MNFWNENFSGNFEDILTSSCHYIVEINATCRQGQCYSKNKLYWTWKKNHRATKTSRKRWKNHRQSRVAPISDWSQSLHGVIWTGGNTNITLDFRTYPNKQHPEHTVHNGDWEGRTIAFFWTYCWQELKTAWTTESIERKDMYLNACSNYHPIQKRSIITTLIKSAERICFSHQIDEEQNHLKGVFT